MTGQRTDLPRRGDWVDQEELKGEQGEEPIRTPEEIEHDLRLHSELPQVVRLSRKTLAIAGGVGATALAAMLLWSLRPAGDSTRPEEVYTTDNRLPAEQIAQLPRDYSGLGGARSDVPQLGPPLTGDLGRPMLNAGVEPQPGDIVPGQCSPLNPVPQRSRTSPHSGVTRSGSVGLRKWRRREPASCSLPTLRAGERDRQPP